MFENVDWNLVFVGLGVLFACLLFIVETYQAYQKYVVPKKEKEKEIKKKKQENELNNVRQVASLLQKSLEERVKTNSFPDFANVGWFYAPSDLEEKGKKYDEKYDLCVDLKRACMTMITSHLQNLTRKRLPKTCKESGFDLATSLNADELVNRYINKEDVTRVWIETTYPDLHSDIMRNLKDGKKHLGRFFIDLNSTFQNDPVLERFRKEKANLIELGNELLIDLGNEEKRLQKELKKI